MSHSPNRPGGFSRRSLVSHPSSKHPFNLPSDDDSRARAVADDMHEPQRVANATAVALLGTLTRSTRSSNKIDLICFRPSSEHCIYKIDRNLRFEDINLEFLHYIIYLRYSFSRVHLYGSDLPPFLFAILFAVILIKATQSLSAFILAFPFSSKLASRLM